MSRRYDVQSAEGVLHDYRGYGVVEIAQSGKPVNGVVGYSPGALWHNMTGGPGTCLYVNIGTFTSAQWINIDSGDDAGMVSLTGTTTLTALLHSGRTMLLNASGGFTTTLPAATGTGNLYLFTIGTVSTTGYVVAAVGSDKILGSLLITPNTATPGGGCAFASTTNATITINGTTKGGVVIGDSFQLQDIATAQWSVKGALIGSGTLATPFS